MRAVDTQAVSYLHLQIDVSSRTSIPLSWCRALLTVERPVLLSRLWAPCLPVDGALFQGLSAWAGWVRPGRCLRVVVHLRMCSSMSAPSCDQAARHCPYQLYILQLLASSV